MKMPWVAWQKESLRDAVREVPSVSNNLYRSLASRPLLLVCLPKLILAVKDYPQFPSSWTVAQGYPVGPSVSRVARCGEGPRGHVNDPR